MANKQGWQRNKAVFPKGNGEKLRNSLVYDVGCCLDSLHFLCDILKMSPVCKQWYSPWNKVGVDREDEFARLDVLLRHVARVFFGGIRDPLSLANPEPSRFSGNLQSNDQKQLWRLCDHGQPINYHSHLCFEIAGSQKSFGVKSWLTAHVFNINCTLLPHPAICEDGQPCWPLRKEIYLVVRTREEFFKMIRSTQP